MTFARLTIVCLVLLSFLGCLFNRELTRYHTSTASPESWFAQKCSPDVNPSFDCRAVLKTRWAVFAPSRMSFVDPDPETGAQPGMPVALFGWYYFTFLLVWFALIGRPAPGRARWHLVPLLVVCAGCAASTFFLYIMFTKMESKCLWCLMSHGINYLLLIGTILLWPRKPKQAFAFTDRSPDQVADLQRGAIETAHPDAEAQARLCDAGQPANEGIDPAGATVGSTVDSIEASDGARNDPLDERVDVPGEDETRIVDGPARHPGSRLIIAVVVCALALMTAEFYSAVGDQSKHMNKLLSARLKAIFDDTLTQLAQFKGRPALELPVRPDDPRSGVAKGAAPLSRLVVFSDFECPACKRLAQELEKSIVPAFGDALEVVWKHLPSCTDCNPKAVRNIHPSACRASYAAEAARLQGGNDAFWRAHDALFDARASLAKIDYVEFARDLGLDPERFVSDMASDGVRERVLEDMKLAHLHGIVATPGLVLDGRKVASYMVYNKHFMEAVEKDRKRQKRRAAKARGADHSR